SPCWPTGSHAQARPCEFGLFRSVAKIGKPSLDLGDAAPTDRHGAAFACREFDRAAVAAEFCAFVSPDVDDVAAVHPGKTPGVQPLLDLADRQRTEIRCSPVEHLGVMRVGVDRDDRI